MATDQDREFLKQLASFTPPSDTAGLRAALDMFAATLNADPPEIGAFHEAVELRPGLTADVAVPKAAGPHPVVVYLHGGGWVAGSAKTHRKLAMQFAERGYLAINVDYRLAPENPFPAGLEDCIFAIKWAGDNARRWNGDAGRIAVGGDSAGGNLTAAALTSLAAESYAGPKPRAALLLYGVYDFPATIARASKEMSIEGMAREYLGASYPAALRDPRVSPLNAVKPGAMPPSFIVCGTADPLLPESKAMAEALKRADIRHEIHLLDEMPHGFMQMGMLSGCTEGLGLMIDFMRRLV
jgi:acetyl esterase/lipase